VVGNGNDQRSGQFCLRGWQRLYSHAPFLQSSFRGHRSRVYPRSVF